MTMKRWLKVKFNILDLNIIGLFVCFIFHFKKATESFCLSNYGAYNYLDEWTGKTYIFLKLYLLLLNFMINEVKIISIDLSLLTSLTSAH